MSCHAVLVGEDDVAGVREALRQERDVLDVDVDEVQTAGEVAEPFAVAPVAGGQLDRGAEAGIGYDVG